MTDRELMQMALDALEGYKNVVTSSNDPKDFGGVVDGGEPARSAIKKLRERLSQPEYEFECPRCGHCCQQREWVGLTNDEIAQAMYKADAIVTGAQQFEFAKEIEAKLKEKNT